VDAAKAWVGVELMAKGGDEIFNQSKLKYQLGKSESI